MIIHPEKLADMQERLYYLEMMEGCLREGLTVTAKQCGANARMFGDKIKRNAYVSHTT